MTMKNCFEERYKTGDTPWDHGTPDVNLMDMVIQRLIPKCKVLDIGCGTGNDTIWLAQQHFVVTGCDISRTAIEKAKEKASMSNVNCSFIVADFLNNRIPGSSFGFVFDRGCLHSVDTEKYRMYIDEVGNPDVENSDNPLHRLLSLTGVIIDLAHIRETVHPQMEELKLNYFDSHPDDPVIFHRKELVNAKHPFEVLHNSETYTNFDNDLLNFLRKWEYTVISVCLDKKVHK